MPDNVVKLNLRLPKALHRRLVKQAKDTNVSLNTLIINELDASGTRMAQQMAEWTRESTRMSVIIQRLAEHISLRDHERIRLVDAKIITREEALALPDERIRALAVEHGIALPEAPEPEADYIRPAPLPRYVQEVEKEPAPPETVKDKP